MNITVIPDIHADMQRLNWSLNTSSTSSDLFFLGDLIDAGKGVKRPDDLGVLKKVPPLPWGNPKAPGATPLHLGQP